MVEVYDGRMQSSAACGLGEWAILYNFELFVGHLSQPIFADTSNNFVSMLAVSGDLSEK